ncbi:type IV secretory system conjugative DNA transfer family protein [Escherichia coli]|nr:conjugal transfer protein TraG [Escherichia coli]EFI4615437.1 type IV secretory system conjugative DNA transfer family protein [Escherichia coli]EFN4546182.1 TraM recognition domain-containing protein [Escherichia coli]EGJ6213899.1 type IV secretory system conjugative DNA transfer family protein [Escherichia coli]EKC7983629.1 type IV secretory system conjugative DNA transfer family protein [Escherichia coli]
MLAFTWFSGSFAFFVLYFNQVQNIKPLKAIFKAIDAYNMDSFIKSLVLTGVADEIRLIAFLALCSGFVLSLAIPVMALIKLNEEKENVFGDARFATIKDVKESNSFTLDGDEKEGIIVGLKDKKIIRYVGAAFSAMGAGTRAGKGAGIVITNLMKYWWSVIILDPKRECFNITSLIRRVILRQEVFKFDPFSSVTHRFNPLFYVSMGTSEGFNQLENLALIVYPYKTDGADAGSYLNKTAGSLFKSLAVTLWFMIAKDKPALKELDIEPLFSMSKINLLFERADPENLLSFLSEIRGDLKDKEKTLVDIGVSGLKAFIEMEDKTKAQLKSNFLNGLSPFSNPNVAKATDGNDFDLRQVRKKRMTVYFCISGDNARLAEKVTNIFFQLAIQVNLEKMPTDDPEIKHDCLFLLDEFPSIGAVDYIKSKSGLIAGYKLKLLIVYQVGSQLEEIYSYAGSKTLLASAPCKIVYSASDVKDARELSEAMGTKTVTIGSKSKSRSRGGMSRSESESLIERPLVTTNELLTLKFSEEILAMKGENPIRCEKAFYYMNEYFFGDFIKVAPSLESVFPKKNGKLSMPPQKVFENEIVAKGYLAIKDVPDLDMAA